MQADTYKYHKLDAPLSLTVEASKDELLSYFETMFRMRRMEMAAEEAYAARKIRGFLHVYNGQESVLTGMESALKRTDSVMTGYRDHCHYLARYGEEGRERSRDVWCGVCVCTATLIPVR